MGLLKSFFSQCARPEGSLGRAMLCFMNYTHAPLTNWGLKLVQVKDGWTMLDVGCGGGFTIRRLLNRSKDAHVYGIDISEESVTKAKKVNGSNRNPSQKTILCHHHRFESVNLLHNKS